MQLDYLFLKSCLQDYVNWKNLPFYHKLSQCDMEERERERVCILWGAILGL